VLVDKDNRKQAWLFWRATEMARDLQIVALRCLIAIVLFESVSGTFVYVEIIARNPAVGVVFHCCCALEWQPLCDVSTLTCSCRTQPPRTASLGAIQQHLQAKTGTWSTQK
jgi:hypothetical protein